MSTESKPQAATGSFFAALGVAWMVWRMGSFPWIALTLAVTFGFYGLLRKRSNLGPLVGLTLETLLLVPFAAGYLLWRFAQNSGALGHVDAATTWITHTQTGKKTVLFESCLTQRREVAKKRNDGICDTNCRWLKRTALRQGSKILPGFAFWRLCVRLLVSGSFQAFVGAAAAAGHKKDAGLKPASWVEGVVRPA